ncbi:hypothetical protein ACHWQZ_G007958 [Mnemiopsis leidyi]
MILYKKRLFRKKIKVFLPLAHCFGMNRWNPVLSQLYSRGSWKILDLLTETVIEANALSASSTIGASGIGKLKWKVLQSYKACPRRPCG